MGEYCLACEERIVSERPELVEDLNAAVRDRRPDDD
jgi:hypothetical protein